MAGIFKAYDIRGIMDKDLNYDLAYKIGNAAAQILNTKEIAVGHDMRNGSVPLYQGVKDGILDFGTDVINVGLIETPMINFVVANYNLGGGIQITASHNPARYNGLKICREMAIPFSYETGISDIEDKVTNTHIEKGVRRGTERVKDIYDAYRNFILKIAGQDPNFPGLKVVIDAGNGMSGYILPKVIKGLDINIIPMYFDLDGTFPNHEANPLKPENVADLRKRVVEEKADIGVAFDGDADRVVFVDEKGNVITSDMITALLSETYLKQKKEKILYDLRSSWAVKEFIEELGGIPIMCRVGHAYIKKQLREEDGAMAGELSGHYYFRENFYTDSGVITLFKVLKLLRLRNGQPISQIIAPIKKYYASGEINSDVADADTKLIEIEGKFQSGKIFHLDGLSVEFEDWWFNIRKSNTEPVLRLNLEAKTEKLMNEKRDMLIKSIRS